MSSDSISIKASLETLIILRGKEDNFYSYWSDEKTESVLTQIHMTELKPEPNSLNVLIPF